MQAERDDETAKSSPYDEGLEAAERNQSAATRRYNYDSPEGA